MTEPGYWRRSAIDAVRQSQDVEVRSAAGASVYAERAQAHALLAIEETLSMLAPALLGRVDPMPSEEYDDRMLLERAVMASLKLDRPYTMDVVLEVVKERVDQVERGYTAEHDDEHGWRHVADQINRFQAEIFDGARDVRTGLVIIAALAIGAVETYDRGDRDDRGEARRG